MPPNDCNAEGAAMTSVLQALAVMEERQGNKEAAIALLERALRQDPIHVHSWQASRLSRRSWPWHIPISLISHPVVGLKMSNFRVDDIVMPSAKNAV